MEGGKYSGVILASGRGSRLGTITTDRPKCMVEVGGHPLLDWQIAALRRAGIDRIVVTTGYRHAAIDALNLKTVHNADWAHTNMVGSLMCAMETVPPPFIVSYSDIIYAPAHVERLLSCPAELAITYDVDWLDLWQRRFDDPLTDAETLVIDANGWLQDIGGKTDRIADIQGQFMGLIKVSATATTWIRDMIAEEPELRASLDMTSLLRKLLDSGRSLQGVPVEGGWCEIDEATDLGVAETLLAEGKLSPICGSR